MRLAPKSSWIVLWRCGLVRAPRHVVAPGGANRKRGLPTLDPPDGDYQPEGKGQAAGELEPTRPARSAARTTNTNENAVRVSKPRRCCRPSRGTYTGPAGCSCRQPSADRPAATNLDPIPRANAESGLFPAPRGRLRRAETRIGACRVQLQADEWHDEWVSPPHRQWTSSIQTGGRLGVSGELVRGDADQSTNGGEPKTAIGGAGSQKAENPPGHSRTGQPIVAVKANTLN